MEAPPPVPALPRDLGTRPLRRMRVAILRVGCVLQPHRVDPAWLLLPQRRGGRRCWTLGDFICLCTGITSIRSRGGSVLETRELPAAQVHVCWCRNPGMHMYRV